MVRKIQGKGKSTSVNHLKKNNDNITSKKDIANTLADSFSKNSSSENYTSKFRNIKNQQEKQKLKFTSDNTENYNSEFLLSELTDALSKAPGFSSRLERGPGAQFSLGTSLTWWAVFVPTGKS